MSPAIPWYQSKTVWLNLILGVTFILALLAPNAPFVDLVTPQLARWIAFAGAVLNIVLRVFFTADPVQNPLR